MAVVLQTLVDSDFEHVVKITTTGTNSAATVVDASGLAGHDSGPKLSIVACQWSVGSQTDILFDATSNVVALSLNGNFFLTSNFIVRIEEFKFCSFIFLSIIDMPFLL